MIIDNCPLTLRHTHIPLLATELRHLRGGFTAASGQKEDVNGESHFDPDGEDTDRRQRPGRNPYRKTARRSSAQINRNRDPQSPHSYPAGRQAVARAYHHRQCIGSGLREISFAKTNRCGSSRPRKSRTYRATRRYRKRRVWSPRGQAAGAVCGHHSRPSFCISGCM